jgi:hypothetical protein
MRSALYFPHTRVSDVGLIKTALLLWDNLEYIVPWRDFRVQYSNRRVAEAKRQAFLDLCRTEKIPAHSTDFRATENYFPDHVVKRVFGPQYRGLSAYEKLADVQPYWGKADNWRLAAAWDLDDVSSTDFGAFLKSL